MTEQAIIALDTRIREVTNELNKITPDLQEAQDPYLMGLTEAFAILTGHQWDAARMKP